MSLLASLLLAQAAAASPAALPPLPTFDAPPSEAVAEEIVVIGRRMEEWKGGLASKDGRLTCLTRKSSGDADVDAIRCGAMLRCFAPEQAEFARLAALDIPRKERDAKMQAHAETLVPCMDAAHEAGMRYLAESRAGAR